MRLHYDLRIIDLPVSQSRTVYPWPHRLAQTLMAIAVTLMAISVATVSAIRVVAIAGRVAGQVIWEDLAYKIGQVLLGRLEISFA